MTPEERLEALLTLAGLRRKPMYHPKEVQAMLSISPTHFRALCDQYDDSGQGLRCVRIGKKRRVEYTALKAWLEQN
jgi:hypothetical protein